MQTLKELPSALVKARLKFKKITKNKEGYGYKYADLGELFDATQDALAEQGIMVIQVPVTPQPNLVGIRTELWHISGETIAYEFVPDLDVKTVGTQKGVQALGSLISYLKRYHYAAIFGLASEDDDGKTAVEQFQSKPKGEAVKQLKIGEDKEKLLVEIRALYGKVPETKRNQISNDLHFSWTEVNNMGIPELKEIKEAFNAK